VALLIEETVLVVTRVCHADGDFIANLPSALLGSLGFTQSIFQSFCCNMKPLICFFAVAAIQSLVAISKAVLTNCTDIDT
jgi:hypothetical protein